ncbi:hypothetical protein AMATHDRAFT_76122 [Amanita thiersii Skay4041]|uniref:AB hydrolase-1 domain-containing protein n=1 Tax=Amanita thiersii Skay4041 TaxID=703135 RepID=A0A2A9NPF2_9AGAR|nr:hypothetical protein AMATHDRAFT_76122 [Amanita thiersii Skay4041]
MQRSIQLDDVNLHYLDADADDDDDDDGQRQLVILLHGFPELSFSWRHILPKLVLDGYHVVAPDQRGYAQTTNIPLQYSDDISPFRVTNLVADIVQLVHHLGYSTVAAIVGHDFGSLVAGYCALFRPDIFQSVVFMSAPFTGPPPSPAVGGSLLHMINDHLATLSPPRTHYMHYFSSPHANEHMCHPPGGIESFLRAYFHVKSGDWAGNDPHPLTLLAPPPSPAPRLESTQLAALASAMSIMPSYYIMPVDTTMPECVSKDASLASQTLPPSPPWLTTEELRVYVESFKRTGFQGGLNWYRCLTDPSLHSDLRLLARKRISVPAMFIAGEKDWGTWQMPGAADTMKNVTCENMADEDFVIIPQAGHWVQQEKPDQVAQHLRRFLRKVNTT